MSVNGQPPRSAPERVLMTTDAVGGVWQYSLHLATCLANSGSEVLLVSFGPRPSDQQKQQVRETPGIRLLETDFALEWMPNPWDDIDRAGEWLLSVERDFRPQVIHLNGYSHGALSWQAPALVVAHSCVYSWWRAVHGEKPGEDWREYKTRVSGGLQSCTKIVAPSGYMADAIANEYAVARDKIEVICNSTPVMARAKVPKQPFALAAGRFWDPAKNLGLLGRIAPRLDWEVRVAGPADGGATDSQESALCNLGVLPGEELVEQFQRASLFLHPALYEPFGLAVLEAASMGCCLALSDIPSLRELWEGAAVFIDPRNAEQWVFEVNNLTRDFEVRESLACAAVARSHRYAADEMLASYVRIYESLREGTGDHSDGVAA